MNKKELNKINNSIQWNNDKKQPFSQGWLINKLIKLYNIKYTSYGYINNIVGIKTAKQSIFWKDLGNEAIFLGIINN